MDCGLGTVEAMAEADHHFAQGYRVRQSGRDTDNGLHEFIVSGRGITPELTVYVDEQVGRCYVAPGREYEVPFDLEHYGTARCLVRQLAELTGRHVPARQLAFA